MEILERKPSGGSLPEQLRRELHQFLRESLGEKRRSSAVRATECAADRQLAEPLEKMALYCVLPEKQRSLEDLLENMDASFSETLMTLIDKSGKKDSEIYKKASLSKQHFSKIRSNPQYRPTKATAIALALALELDLEGTKDLIGRAGFTLSASSKFDLIIRFFIERGIYDVVQINMALYEFDQPLLGG